MKHKHNSKQISVIAVMIAVVLVWISCPVYATNQLISNENLLPSWIEKIDPAIYEKAEKKDDKYLVYIFRDDISTETINETVTRETRFDTSLYESDKFESCVVPELERQIELYEQMNQAQLSMTSLVLGNPTVPTIQKAKQIEMNAYVEARRGVIRELNTEKNDLFVNKYIEDASDIVYQSQYTSTIMAYLTKEEIEMCAHAEDVVSIRSCEPGQVTPQNSDIEEQIGVDSLSGTKSNQFNSGLGYRGDGVKIGIVEGACGIYDKDHPQLSGISNIRLYVLDNEKDEEILVTPQITDHATFVTTLIVGQRIELGGKVFEGVVPDATVYLVPTDTKDTNLLNAIEVLISNHVSVINLSIGNNEIKGAYSELDCQVDKLIESSDVTVVVAAGNYGYDTSPRVSSPGKAYNAITVGGVANKLASYLEYPPYMMYDDSSYSVTDYLTNKPDIVAPGQGFCFVKRDSVTGELYIDTNYYNGWDYYYSGTSLSTPLVTGVVAQMHEANASLLDNPTATKAIVLAGADFDAVSGNNNALWDYCYAARVKSGVGFLNAERAVRIAEEGNYDYNVYFLNLTSRYVEQSIVCEEVYIPANHKIRMVMTYSKPAEFDVIEEFANGNDMDLDLFYQDRTWCDSSLTPYNNVEVVEYVVDTAGTYSIEVYVPKLTQSRLGVVIHRTVAWYIEPVS